ncbi:MAG: hypothetical protein FWB95_02600 [Treponema sp.]|nr:hypothetical protein [Treponema sp.]
MSRKDRLNSAKAELEQINKAINTILGGAQSYTMGSRSLTRANLETLYKRKDKLEDLIAALSGGSGRFRRVVPI